MFNVLSESSIKKQKCKHFGNASVVRVSHRKKLKASFSSSFIPLHPLKVSQNFQVRFCVLFLHSINSLTHSFMLQCVWQCVLLILVMSQAVLLSEDYGGKVTSCFILISIITLWRPQLLLSFSVFCPPSISPSLRLVFLPFPAHDLSVEAICDVCFIYVWICQSGMQMRRDNVMQMW